MKYADIRPGRRVAFETPQGHIREGRVVMRSRHGGWVLNLGGPHGTPGLVDESNFLWVRGGRK